MVHYVYILLCHDTEYYTGITYDLKKRLKEHQSGESKSTAYRLPVKLIWFAGFVSQSKAARFEKYLKSHSGRRFRDRFII